MRVEVAHDKNANVWYIKNSDVPGLSGESDDIRRLVDRLPGLIMDLVPDQNCDEVEFYFRIVNGIHETVIVRMGGDETMADAIKEALDSARRMECN